MSNDEQPRHDAHPRVLIGAGLLLVAGTAMLGVGLHAQQNAPQPPASAARPALTSTLVAAGPQREAVQGRILTAAVPTQLNIPSIGVSSNLLRLGLNPDHTTQVPPLTRKAQAGWFQDSPSPGQLGPSIILGHVDSAKYGPGVFFKLGSLRPGARVSITRADHSVAVFRVDQVVSYAKNNFPTLDVYGNTDHAALRLITCGGKFNPKKHSYQSNIVAYASLVTSHRA